MVKHPLEHSSSACQSIRVLRGELLVKDPSDEGLKPASQSLTLGLHSFARLRAENIKNQHLLDQVGHRCRGRSDRLIRATIPSHARFSRCG